jgi:hypothetical protein
MKHDATQITKQHKRASWDKTEIADSTQNSAPGAPNFSHLRLLPKSIQSKYGGTLVIETRLRFGQPTISAQSTANAMTKYTE